VKPERENTGHKGLPQIDPLFKTFFYQHKQYQAKYEGLKSPAIEKRGKAHQEQDGA
jgi:hypothetical protein